MALFNKIQSYAWKQLKVSGTPWQLTKKKETKGLLTASQASGSPFLFESWVWLCLLFCVIWGLFVPFTRQAPAAKNWSELKKPLEWKVQHLYITKKNPEVALCLALKQNITSGLSALWFGEILVSNRWFSSLSDTSLFKKKLLCECYFFWERATHQTSSKPAGANVWVNEWSH